MAAGDDDPLRVRREDVPRELLDRSGHDLARRVAVGFGALLHLAAGALIAGTGSVAPSWAVAGFAVLWGAGAWLMLRWRHRWALLPLLVPFAVLGTVWLAVAAGGAWLGWSA